jgi:hypothetical protein
MLAIKWVDFFKLEIKNKFSIPLFSSKNNYQIGAIPMRCNEHYYANPRAFFRLTSQYQDSKVRQSRLLRRFLDEIKSSSSIPIS